MQTLAQMKAEIYNALTNDSTMEGYIGSRVYWLGKVSGKSTFPLIDYKAFDEIGTYSFGGSGISYDGSEATFQIDVYTGPDDVATMDNIIERLKTLMHGLGYRLINSPIEFVDAEVNKIVRPTRWEKWNV